MSDKFKRLAAEIRQDLDIEYNVRFNAPRGLASPIEEAVFWSLLYLSAYVRRPAVGDDWFEVWSYSGKYRFQTQHSIEARGNKYRVDLAAPVADRILVIECDGHDFHERTRDQAARDRKRDRDLQAIGCRVLRFTGSEIHAHPKGVALEILTTLDSMVGYVDADS